jgi:hypothetical protein
MVDGGTRFVEDKLMTEAIPLRSVSAPGLPLSSFEGKSGVIPSVPHHLFKRHCAKAALPPAGLPLEFSRRFLHAMKLLGRVCAFVPLFAV